MHERSTAQPHLVSYNKNTKNKYSSSNNIVTPKLTSVSNERKILPLPKLKLLPKIATQPYSAVDDPMDIDLIRHNESKNLAIVNGQIQDIDFSIVCDSGSNKSGMPIECCNELGLNIDTEKNHKLSGFATEKKSVGMVYDVPITLAPGCTIVEDFVVIEGHSHRELILSRTCLKRYNYDLLESREHMAITCNGKHYFIPIISMNRDFVSSGNL
jgi:hypothetical protein